MSSIVSPLRYPGGKSKLWRYVRNLLQENDLVGCTYIEPFAGGAGVACHLLLDECVSNVVINDISLPIYSFWYSVLNHTDELCKLINDVSVNMEERKKQKLVISNTDTHSTFEVGFAAFFLNRVNRSGILNGGVIGGKAQEGNYKMDARFTKHNLIARIQKIATHKNRISVYNQDVLDFVSDTLPKMNSSSFVYFDPPYYMQGSTLYENNFKHEDHAKLASVIRNDVKLPWIVSYDNVQEILDLYKEIPSEFMDIVYTAQSKYTGSEVVFYSSELKIPQKSVAA